MDQVVAWIVRQKKIPITYPCRVLGLEFADAAALEEMLKDLNLWTYRCDFAAPLPKSNITSDKGWGCLIRTGQMLLSRALRLHDRTLNIVPMFYDSPDESACFSIHNLIRAVANPREPFRSEYWSPSQTCDAIRATLTSAPLPVKLGVYIGDNGCLYNDEILFILEHSPVLLLVPIRTGCKSRITQNVFSSLQHFLDHSTCCGIVGGEPKRSYYLIGYSQLRMLYLDPHQLTQPACAAGKEGILHERAETLPSVEWKRIDSSLLIGFYLRDPRQWLDLTQHLENTHRVNGEKFIFVNASRADGTARHRGNSCDDADWDSDEEKNK